MRKPIIIQLGKCSRPVHFISRISMSKRIPDNRQIHFSPIENRDIISHPQTSVDHCRDQFSRTSEAPKNINFKLFFTDCPLLDYTKYFKEVEINFSLYFRNKSGADIPAAASAAGLVRRITERVIEDKYKSEDHGRCRVQKSFRCEKERLLLVYAEDIRAYEVN